MHTNALAHRDIKPANILKMKNGKYVLMDFGIGINLENGENYDEKIYNYQSGKWALGGTPRYLGPKLKKHFNSCEEKPDQ